MNPDMPIPYSLKSDDLVSAIILVCFFLLSFIFAGNKKYLLQQARIFIQHKERANLFGASTSVNRYFSLVVILQTSLLIGIVFLSYFNFKCPDFAQGIPSYLPIGVYAGLFLVYVFLKRTIYAFLGWVFFGKNATTLWLEAYFTLVYYAGFILFPYVLLLVYFNFDIEIMLTFGFVILIIAKLLMLYKWIKFFFNNIYGLSLLILYFCALEIMPCFIYYRVLVNINSLLLIKF
ncbi:DUF4271 domain-containing protein [Bacteroides sp. 519]|uniref:DUF4271 domain-containing protein n=1 Tax=Bacteroides sp. 519 TaxID=2302937 RepID=UPI0013D12B72|nr:DUF4271 domain-containing protein [Bacteroides sp. 519]NDV57546.1 DUF4271 domain-containing protein [Bacteroides sp. 519]